MSTSARDDVAVARRVRGRSTRRARRRCRRRASRRCRARRAPRRTRGSAGRCRSARPRRRRRCAGSSCSRRRRRPGPQRDAARRRRRRGAGRRARPRGSAPSGVAPPGARGSRCRWRAASTAAAGLMRATTMVHGARAPRRRRAAIADSPPVPTQVMRGSRRNHMRWRAREGAGAADDEVGARLRARSRSRRGGGRASPGSRWPGSRRPRQPGRRAVERADLVDEARVEHRGERVPRCGRACSARGSHTPIMRTGEPRAAPNWSSAGAERRERLAGEAGSPRARARCGGGCAARCGPRRPDRAPRARGTRGAAPRPRRSRPRARPAAARSSPGNRRSSTTAAHVQPGAADEQRAVAARLDVGERGARAGLGARDRPVVAGVGDVDEVVRHRGLLGRASAWRCRCPCPGTPASSRATRSRRRRAPRASANASADLPDAVGPTSAR